MIGRGEKFENPFGTVRNSLNEPEATLAVVKEARTATGHWRLHEDGSLYHHKVAGVYCGPTRLARSMTIVCEKCGNRLTNRSMAGGAAFIRATNLVSR
jgi:hypothetical protein